ncbi:hypothetical protein VPH35_112691 [Triticum aestivum]|uniref:Uncharacterized protein n=1 Tax=Triticum aestivum TaxID=4565 RepID=A0A3B6PRP6_WHEAT
MTPYQIAIARRQAGMHPAGQGVGVQQGNVAAQIVPAAIQPQVQHLPPAANNLIAEAIRPVAAAGATTGAQGLAILFNFYMRTCEGITPVYMAKGGQRRLQIYRGMASRVVR